MLPLLPLLLPCCSAQRRKAVVALRGDAFRFGHNSKQGCVHVNQSYANQLWQVESIKRYVIEPLRAAVGFEPRTSIDRGIPNFVAWYRDYYGLEAGTPRRP